MTEEEALVQLAQECPRKILGMLHARGQYIHCNSKRFPGKVLCFHKDSELPEDCEPTAAQALVWQSQQTKTQGATG